MKFKINLPGFGKEDVKIVRKEYPIGSFFGYSEIEVYERKTDRLLAYFAEPDGFDFSKAKISMKNGVLLFEVEKTKNPEKELEIS